MSSISINRAAPANPASGASTTAQVFSLASNAQAAASVSIPGKLALEGKRFSVRAEGNCVVSVNTTSLLITLLGVTGAAPPANPLVIGSWTTIGAGGAQSGAVAFPWWLQADLIFDSLSGLLQGVFQQVVNNKLTATAVITGVLTGLQGTNQPVTQAGPVVVQPSDPVATLAVAATFGAGNAANLANLMNFEVGF